MNGYNYDGGERKLFYNGDILIASDVDSKQATRAMERHKKQLLRELKLKKINKEDAN